MTSVYWVGTDGNVWFKSSGGVRNAGKPIKLTPGGFDSKLFSAEAKRIADPNPPRKNTASAPAGGSGGSSGGGGGSVRPDRSNDIALQLAGLKSADAQTSTGLKGLDNAFAKLIGQYSTESSANEKNASQQSDTNQNNLQKKNQSSLIKASQGLRGLSGTLASIGALNGSGVELANRAVQQGANEDLSDAQDTYAGNQSSIDTAIGNFRSEDKRRRQDARTAKNNARQNVLNLGAKNKQSFYSNLANDYATMGNSALAKLYSSRAAKLYPALAKTSVPNSNIAYSGAAYTPAALANYLAGGSTIVSAAPASGGGSRNPGLVASNVPGQKRKETS